MRKTLLTFCILVSQATLFAQGECNNWFFGYGAGLSWNGGTPVVVSGSPITQQEGCSSISDSAGTLLFYTDGVKVWNRLHNQMPNGSGLKGSSSSSQSAIIVPWPDSTKKYFIFTTSYEGQPNGLRYSVVDMALSGGLGSVVASSKNTLLHTPTTEKITAVKHANGKDVWVISHDWNSSSFRAYLVTSAGVSSGAVITNIGMVHTGGSGCNAMGCMKVSPDGTKLALAVHCQSFVECFSFDPSTGIATNNLFLDSAYYSPNLEGAYGVEFSPNGRFLYTLEMRYTPRYGRIYQYDLWAMDILGSRTEIAVLPTEGNIQLGPDGKMYITLELNLTTHWLDVINFPDELGSLCGYQDSVINLQGASCALGLPNFITSYFNFSNGMNATEQCVGRLTEFSITGPEVDSVSWNFGDTISGVNNSAAGLNTAHTYFNSGNYFVEAVLWQNSVSDTITRHIVINQVPVVNIGNDTLLCSGQQLTLHALNPGSNYIWNNGATTESINVTSSGIFTVNVNNHGCVATDTILVNVLPSIALELGPDTIMCYGQILTLNAFNTGGNYTWQNNSTNSSISVIDSGTYWVQVDVSGCQAADTIKVSYRPMIHLDLGSDTIICMSDSVMLNAAIANANYNWQDNSTTPEFIAVEGGQYSVTVTIDGCSAIDTINISEFTPAPATLSANQIGFCEGDSTEICVQQPFSTYLWNTGETASCISVSHTGIYYLTTTDGNQCTTISDSIEISVHALPQVVVFNVGDTLKAQPTGTYQWYLNDTAIIGATESIIVIQSGGTYVVEVTDTNFCSAVSAPIVISSVRDCINQSSVQVFPNPSRTNWKLQVSTDLIGSEIHILNTNGQLLVSSVISTDLMDIALDVSKGIYFLHIHTTDKVLLVKLVKL